MKRTLALLLTAALSLSLLGGCGRKAPPAASSGPDPAVSSSGSSQPDGSDSSSPPEADAPVIRFMALSGPTGVGASWLMNYYSPENAPADAPFLLDGTIVTDNQEVTNALINGDADIAAVATNVAANLYAKSDGAIQVLAVNTLGVLYILEKGNTVHSISDLKGQVVYAPSNTKGANPEHILNHLLKGNGVDPSQVKIEWLTPQEITVKMTSSDAGICMLPVPAATALLVQDSGVREAVSLSEAWMDLEESELPMGCLAARTELIERSDPALIEAFLDLYGDSISFVEGNPSDAAALAVELGILPSEKVAERAIPQCALTLTTGQEMKTMLESYYSILFRTAPESIGGGLPYDSFYYGVG